MLDTCVSLHHCGYFAVAWPNAHPEWMNCVLLLRAAESLTDRERHTVRAAPRPVTDGALPPPHREKKILTRCAAATAVADCINEFYATEDRVHIRQSLLGAEIEQLAETIELQERMTW